MLHLLIEPGYLILDKLGRDESRLADLASDLFGLLFLPCKFGLDVATGRLREWRNERQAGAVCAVCVYVTYFAFGMVGVPVPLPDLLPCTLRRAFLTPPRLDKGDDLSDLA